MDKLLRDDLDVLCSAFLSRGGWGNHGDPPRLILYALATDAAQRGVYLSDAAGEYVAEVLTRAGEDSERADLTGREVASIIYNVVGSIEFADKGRKYLDWWRSRPRHEATDPMSDPRFKEMPRHMVFRDGDVEAWICATDGELASWPIEVPNLPPDGAAIPLFHRVDGPALVIRHQGEVVEELWVHCGRLHRAGGPAHVLHGPDGYRRWYLNGIEQFDEDPDGDDEP